MTAVLCLAANIREHDAFGLALPNTAELDGLGVHHNIKICLSGPHR